MLRGGGAFGVAIRSGAGCAVAQVPVTSVAGVRATTDVRLPSRHSGTTFFGMKGHTYGSSAPAP
eukprot:6960871-Prymnesium_polylepis.1